MKHFKSFLTILAVASLSIFIACGGGGSKKEDPEPEGKLKAEQLSFDTWAPSDVKLDNTPRTEWENFTLSFTANSSFTGGNYSTSGVPTDDGASDVWSASGSWAFVENSDGSLNLNQIIKDGDTANPVSVTVGINETAGTGDLTLSWTVPESGARIEGFTGNWAFTFELQQ